MNLEWAVSRRRPDYFDVSTRDRGIYYTAPTLALALLILEHLTTRDVRKAEEEEEKEAR